MPLNTDKLLAELRYLTIHPEKWDQTIWARAEQVERPRVSACGSYGCLAGNTVLHDGFELDWHKNEHYVFEQDEDGNLIYSGGELIPVTDENGNHKVVIEWLAEYVVSSEPGDPILIEDQAAIELGLNPFQASVLFRGDQNEETLWSLACDLTSGEISSGDYARARFDRDSLIHADTETA